MPLLTDEKYSFKSKALSHDDLAVVEFTGTEGLSRPYEFDVLLASDNPNLDLAEVMSKPATLTIHRPQGDVAFHGRLKLLEQKHSFRDYVFYRAVLAPRFSRLARSFHNQIFLDMNLPDILTAVLRDGGLEEDDFELRLQQEYPAWEYVCQYQESHFAFVSRWMERDGLYYWFEQGPDKEKLIITDSALSHTDMPHGGDITYSPVSGLDAGHAEEVVQAVSWRRGLLPKEIELRDYNYRRPSLDLTVTAPGQADGPGSGLHLRRALPHSGGRHGPGRHKGRRTALPGNRSVREQPGAFHPPRIHLYSQEPFPAADQPEVPDGQGPASGQPGGLPDCGTERGP